MIRYQNFKVVGLSLLVIVLHLNYSSAINLPCTGTVNAATIRKARNVIKDHTPPGFTLVDLVPQFTSGANPHRWLGTFTDSNNNYSMECGSIRNVQNSFRSVAPAKCSIGTVTIQPVPNNPVISVEFIRDCSCSRPQRSRKNNETCSQGPCKGWVDPPFLYDSVDELPCPVSGFYNENVIASAREILKNNTPSGYTLDTLSPGFTVGHNPRRWIATFIRLDGRYDIQNCTFLHEVKLAFRYKAPGLSSDVKTLSVQRTSGKERYEVEYLVNCFCNRHHEEEHDNENELTGVLRTLRDFVKASLIKCGHPNEFGYVKDKNYVCV